MKKTYSIEISCINCKKTTWFHDIPNGTTWVEHLKGVKCKHCDCDIVLDLEKMSKGGYN